MNNEEISWLFFMHSNFGNHCTTKNSIILKDQSGSVQDLVKVLYFAKMHPAEVSCKISDTIYLFFPLYILECPSYQQQNQYKINMCMIFEPIHGVKLARKI